MPQALADAQGARTLVPVVLGCSRWSQLSPVGGGRPVASLAQCFFEQGHRGRWVGSRPSLARRGSARRNDRHSFERPFGSQIRISTTATKSKLPNVGWTSGKDLLDEIASKDRETFNCLQGFITAYIDWSRFHEQIAKLGESNLDREEPDQLAALVGKRNETRDAILRRLEVLE